MKRWSKVGFIVVIPATLMGGLWVLTCLGVRHGERYFLEKSDPRRALHPVLADYEWAMIFYGHAGLGRLRELSRDPSLSVGQRKVADQTADYIQDGRYLREIEWLESLTPFYRSPEFRTELWCFHLRELLYTVVYPAPNY